MMYGYNTWPSCWGNYSFALTLSFKPTLPRFHLHTVDDQPSGGLQWPREAGTRAVEKE